MAKVIQKRCKQCQKLFSTNNRQKQYCSNRCKLDNRKIRHTYSKKCPVCGKEFQTHKRDIKCCSPECSNKLKASWDTTKTIHYYCEYCSKDMGTRRNGVRDKKFCSNDCKLRAQELKYKHSDPYGYVNSRVESFGRRTRYHRAVMEKHLGRKLTRDEVVHHIDGNKFNNDISNLQLLTNSEHARLHSSRRKHNELGQFT